MYLQSVQHAARLGHAVAAKNAPQVTPGAGASYSRSGMNSGS